MAEYNVEENFSIYSEDWLSSEEDSQSESVDSLSESSYLTGNSDDHISPYESDDGSSSSDDDYVYVDEGWELESDIRSESTQSSSDEAQAHIDPVICENAVITATESCLLVLQYSLR